MNFSMSEAKIILGNEIEKLERGKTYSEEEILQIISDYEYGAFIGVVDYYYNYEPSDVVAREAFKTYPNAIEYIDNPTIDMQIRAVQKDYILYTKINNPSYEAKLEAVKVTPRVIRYIADASKELQMMVMKNNPALFGFIHTPCDEAKIEYLKYKHGLGIRGLENPSERVQLESLKIKWTRSNYSYIMRLGKKSDWFQREVNRLKLFNGPLNENPND